MIVRRERPHRGAQLSFTDHNGHRFPATLTDLDGAPVELERLHRARAEDRVRNGKPAGLENLPSATSTTAPSGSSSRWWARSRFPPQL